MIDRSWKEKYLADATIRPLRDIFDERRAGSTCCEWRDTSSRWLDPHCSQLQCEMVLLAILSWCLPSCSIPLAQALLGFNVLEELIQNRPAEFVPALTMLLSDAISASAES